MTRSPRAFFREYSDDVIFVIVSLIVLFGASFLLYRDIKQRGTGSGELVGKITFKNHVAQRKFDRQVVWEEVETSSDLYNGDWIRTADLSEAELELKDGTKITLDQNSMILLNITDKASKINFIQGAVAAKGASKGLEISAQDKVINVGDGDVQLSGTGDKELALVVKKGEASVSSGGGKEERINQNEKATVGKNISVKKVTLRQTYPGDGARVFTPGAKDPVAFSWERAGQVTLEVSPDRSFGGATLRAASNGDSQALALGEGIYYWRITQGTDTSDVRRLSIIRKKPLSLYSPSPGATFEYATSDPFINFSFQKDEFADDYNLEVFRDSGLTDRVFNTSTRTANISTHLPAGRYFWRVSSQSGVQGASNTSLVSEFSVLKRDKIAPPVLLRPESGRTISAVFLEKEGVVFSWSGAPEIKRYTISVAPSNNMESAVIAESAQQNFFNIRKTLAVGSYIWRVQGFDESGRATDFSAPGRFVVAENQEIKLEAPAEGAAVDYPGDVVLRWDGPDLMRYEVQVADNASFNPLLVKDEIQSRSHTVKNLKPGKYVWRVMILGDTGPIAQSQTRSLVVADKLSDPGLIFPANNGIVDMAGRDALPFEWSPSPAASGYLIKVHQMVYTKPKLIAQGTVNTPNFAIRDLTTLDVGLFSYSLQAYRDVDGKRQLGREITVFFTIVLGKNPGKPEIKSPKVQFAE
ncbi:MAG: FecR domain-containing protein [Spirochaetia bacterium]|nr:FecR domain-containing protein [Spirochaetia bacterium]